LRELHKESEKFTNVARAINILLLRAQKTKLAKKFLQYDQQA
jgi:hypothetical protein